MFIKIFLSCVVVVLMRWSYLTLRNWECVLDVLIDFFGGVVTTLSVFFNWKCPDFMDQDNFPMVLGSVFTVVAILLFAIFGSVETAFYFFGPKK